MDRLQKFFDSEMKKITDPKLLLKKILRDKLNKLHVKIPDKYVDEVVEKYASSDGPNFTFEMEEVSKDISIKITRQDIKKYTNKLVKNLDKAYKEIIKDTSKRTLQIMLENRSTLRFNRKLKMGFEKRLERTWRKGFDLLEIFISAISELGGQFNNEHRPTAIMENDLVFEVLIRLHARSCQIALEVLTLLKAGFADGAHARWRTIHEITVIGLFIEQFGQEVAERYLCHEAVETYKASIQYQQHYARLNYDPIPENELIINETNYREVLTKYGKSFGESYGWAGTVLNKKSPTFSDIEKAVDLEHIRPFYKLASHNIHANPKGVTFKLGNSHPAMQLLAGPSNTGFTDPAQGTALSLYQLTVTIYSTKTNLDALVMSEMLRKFAQKIGSEFLRIQKRVDKRALENIGFIEDEVENLND